MQVLIANLIYLFSFYLPTDVEADALTLSPGTTFTSDQPTTTTVTLDYTLVAGSPNPTDVNLYFENDSVQSAHVPVTVNGPTGSPLTGSGSYVDMEAVLTIDDANCDYYTRLCAEILVVDDNQANNIVCTNLDASNTICDGMVFDFIMQQII